MTSRELKTKYDDSFMGRLRAVYELVWGDFGNFGTSQPFKRSLAYIFTRKAIENKLPLTYAIFLIPLSLLLDPLRILGFILLLSANRMILPKLGNFETTTRITKSFYQKNPVHHVIQPNPNCGKDETGDCDGEHLWVSDYFNFYAPILSWIFIGWPCAFLIGDDFWKIALFLASPFFFTFIPVRTGVLFHRRAQTATFYRGWLLPKVTVPFEQVSYSSGFDPSGGNSWLIIRAKVPWYFSLFGYTRFFSATSTFKSQTVGAICAFMDLTNNYAQSTRVKESIEWHKRNNTTLWRYAFGRVPKEFVSNYQDPTSLYNLTQQLIDPRSKYFGQAVEPNSRDFALSQVQFHNKLKEKVEEQTQKVISYEEIKPKLFDFFSDQLNGKNVDDQKASILKLSTEHYSEVAREISFRLDLLYEKCSDILQSSHLQPEKFESKKQTLIMLRSCLSTIDSDSYSKIATKFEDLLRFLSFLKTEFHKGHFSEDQITQIVSSLSQSNIKSADILKSFDWDNFVNQKVGYILLEEEIDKPSKQSMT